MANRKCSGLCVSHFGFTKRYQKDKTPQDRKRYNRERMRAWRKGIKGLPKPCYKTHYYCTICKVWIPKTEGYSICPCCFSKLKGVKLQGITIKERTLRSLLFTTKFLFWYLILCYVALFGLLLSGRFF